MWLLWELELRGSSIATGTGEGFCRSFVPWKSGSKGQKVKRERNLGHLEFLGEKGWVWDAVV